MTHSFEASIVLHMVDRVSGAMGAIGKALTRNQAAADALQSRLNKIHSTFQSGLVMGMGASALAAPLIAAAHEGQEYLHVLNQMHAAGMSNKQVAESMANAWRITGTVITSTVTGNLQVIQDLQTVLGNNKEANAFAEPFIKIQGAFAGILDGKMSGKAINDQSFAMAKSIDMLGHVKNAKEIQHHADNMFRVAEATQGRVMPSDYMTTLKFSRQAKYGLSDEFLYKKLPELIIENKGGNGSAGGVGPQIAALHRFGVQGIMNKQSAAMFDRLGMVPKSSILKTTTSGTTLKAGLLGSDILAADPHKWVNEVLVPRIIKAHHLNPKNTDAIMKHIIQMFKGNQGAASFAAELYKKNFIFQERFPKLFDQTQGLEKAYNSALKNDPNTNWLALGNAFKNLKTVFGAEIIPVIIPWVLKLTDTIQKSAIYLKNNPEITKAISGFFALGTTLFATGAAIQFARAAFMGLKFVFSPLGKAIKGVWDTAVLVASRVGPFIMRAVPWVLNVMNKMGLVGLAIGALILALTNWDGIMKFVHKNHKFFIHIAAEVVRATDWLNEAFEGMIKWFAQLGAAIGKVMGEIGSKIANLPIVGQTGLMLKQAGNEIQTNMSKAMQVDQMTSTRDEKFLKEKGFGGLVGALKGKSSTTVNQTNHVTIQQVPGHDHEKCWEKGQRKLIKNVIHGTMGSSGNSTGSSIFTQGSGRP